MFRLCKRETGPGGHFEIRDPAVEYIGKNQFEDREIRVTTLTNYIANIVNNEFIMAPTFTVYKNKKTRSSISYHLHTR